MISLLSPAGRMQIVNDLMSPDITDDEDRVIGQCDPLITKEEALKLLDMEDVPTFFKRHEDEAR